MGLSGPRGAGLLSLPALFRHARFRCLYLLCLSRGQGGTLVDQCLLLQLQCLQLFSHRVVSCASRTGARTSVCGVLPVPFSSKFAMRSRIFTHTARLPTSLLSVFRGAVACVGLTQDSQKQRCDPAHHRTNSCSATEARSALKTVLDRVYEDADVTVISRRDGADAVVMSLDHYQSIMGTMHLLSTPANAAHLAK